MTGLIVMIAAGAAMAIAISLCVDLLPRRMDVQRLTNWPFKDMPATNGAVFMTLFLAAVVACIAFTKVLLG